MSLTSEMDSTFIGTWTGLIAEDQENGLSLIAVVVGLPLFVLTPNDVKSYLKIIARKPWLLIRSQIVCQHNRRVIVASTRDTLWIRCENCSNFYTERRRNG